MPSPAFPNFLVFFPLHQILPSFPLSPLTCSHALLRESAGVDFQPKSASLCMSKSFEPGGKPDLPSFFLCFHLAHFMQQRCARALTSSLHPPSSELPSRSIHTYLLSASQSHHLPPPTRISFNERYATRLTTSLTIFVLQSCLHPSDVLAPIAIANSLSPPAVQFPQPQRSTFTCLLQHHRFHNRNR